MKEQQHIFTNKMLRTLLIPVIFEQVLNSLMGTVDTMMVSNVGSAAISAVSLVDSINVLVIQAFSALAAGGAILCSQYIGQKNHEMANKSARQVLFIITAISVAVTALSYYSHQTDSYTDSCNTVKVLKDIRHCLSCNGYRPQCRYGRLYCQLSKLKHAVLYTGRDSQSQNSSDHFSIRTDLSVISDYNRLSVHTKLPEYHYSTEDSGCKSCDGSSCHSHIESPDQRRISADINHI